MTKIEFDLMSVLIAERKERVNKAFAQRATEDLHRDLAHAQKLQWAYSLDDRLQREANLRGISITQLRDMILAKASDAIADREYQRQQIMARIEACRTPDELDAI